MNYLLMQKHGKPVIVLGFADDRFSLYAEAGYAPLVTQPIETALNARTSGKGDYKVTERNEAKK